MMRRYIRVGVWVCCALALAWVPAGAAPHGDREKALALFAYDAGRPLAIREKRIRKGDGIEEYDLSFASPKGGRVSAYLLVPSGGKGPYAGILLLHGATGSRRSLLPGARLLCRAGAVCLLPDAPFCGDRAEMGKRLVDINKPEQMRAGVIQSVVELRRGVDLLVARPDVDRKRIAFIGSSLGGSIGGILAGVEKRVAAYALLVASGSWHEAAMKSRHPLARLARLGASKQTIEKAATLLADVDPIHYVGHAAPCALLFQNGRRDTTVPAECAQAYQDAGSQPKVCKWYPSGHELDIDAFMERAEWLHEKIGIQPIPRPTHNGGLNH
jgi:cephalosporin-C deacetylase-like acetyl esterase